jgi:flavin reductase (DIM6/NTAB) family NADH-FMN oxidoreductase RutF
MKATYDDILMAADPAALVVTTRDGDGPAGCLVSFATPCSIDPNRYLVMLSVENHTFTAAGRADVLAVHVLGEEDSELSARFGELTEDVVDKFAGLSWRPGVRDVPILDAGLAWMAGAIERRIELGDHVGFVLEPLDSGVRSAGRPLRFHDIRHLRAGHPA